MSGAGENARVMWSHDGNAIIPRASHTLANLLLNHVRLRPQLFSYIEGRREPLVLLNCVQMAIWTILVHISTVEPIYIAGTPLISYKVRVGARSQHIPRQTHG